MTKSKTSETLVPSGIPQIRMVMLPKDTNSMGNIFGGVILSHLDLAAGEHARRIAPHLYVTKVLREVEFIAPVLVGDSVSYYAETVKIGRTSITVKVLVLAERGVGLRESVKVTEAEVVMVAVDDHGSPIPILVSNSDLPATEKPARTSKLAPKASSTKIKARRPLRRIKRKPRR